MKKQKSAEKAEVKGEDAKKEVKTESKAKAVKHLSKNVLVKPWVTEKSTDLSKQNKFVFLVSGDATKPLVKENIAERYNVKALKVDIVNTKGKMKHFMNRSKRRSPLKKAVITLKKGDTIELQ